MELLEAPQFSHATVLKNIVDCKTNVNIVKNHRHKRPRLQRIHSAGAGLYDKSKVSRQPSPSSSIFGCDRKNSEHESSKKVVTIFDPS